MRLYFGKNMDSANTAFEVSAAMADSAPATFTVKLAYCYFTHFYCFSGLSTCKAATGCLKKWCTWWSLRLDRYSRECTSLRNFGTFNNVMLGFTPSTNSLVVTRYSTCSPLSKHSGSWYFNFPFFRKVMEITTKGTGDLLLFGRSQSWWYRNDEHLESFVAGKRRRHGIDAPICRIA